MNKKLKILFLHGKEGTPEGTKPTFLRSVGHWVIAPVLPKNDWDLSVRRAHDCFTAFRPDVIIGSSRGGAVACELATGDIPKILIAPAYKHFPCKINDLNKSTTVLHCPEDAIVKFEHSKNLEEAFGVKLIACGENHRMGDKDALAKLLKAVTKIANESR